MQDRWQASARFCYSEHCCTLGAGGKKLQGASTALHLWASFVWCTNLLSSSTYTKVIMFNLATTLSSASIIFFQHRGYMCIFCQKKKYIVRTSHQITVQTKDEFLLVSIIQGDTINNWWNSILVAEYFYCSRYSNWDFHRVRVTTLAPHIHAPIEWLFFYSLISISMKSILPVLFPLAMYTNSLFT